MKRKTGIALLAAAFLLGACDRHAIDDQARHVDTRPAAPSMGRVETDGFLMTLHRAVPFIPGTASAALLKARNGYRYLVLDISIKNKGREALNMAALMLGAKITDENGRSYALHPRALSAYISDHPSQSQQAEYEAMHSAAFQPGETHRAMLLGLELPQEVKALVLSIPAGPGTGGETRKIRFPVL